MTLATMGEWTTVDPTTGCWNWKRAINGSTGRPNKYHRRKYMLAYRAVYEIAKGVVIPDGQEFLHQCDNKICVNPDHVRPGTHTQNIMESVERNRMRRGSDRTQARLVESQIVEIRRLRENGQSLNSLATKYGVSFQTISAICHRKMWRHVA